MTRQHLLVDWWFAESDWLRTYERLRKVVRTAVAASGHSLLGETYHDFQPVGFTGLVLLSESHVAVHSWVEEGLLTVDVFSCRPGGAAAIVAALRAVLAPQREVLVAARRGEALLVQEDVVPAVERSVP